MYRTLFAIHRWHGTTFEQFERHYRDVHAQFGKKIPGLVAYDVYLAKPLGPDGGATVEEEGPVRAGAPQPDAFTIMTWESHEAFMAATQTPEFQAGAADSEGFAGQVAAYLVEHYSPLDA
jgi:uncharacterized protein (TIGR02118 family)